MTWPKVILTTVILHSNPYHYDHVQTGVVLPPILVTPSTTMAKTLMPFQQMQEPLMPKNVLYVGHSQQINAQQNQWYS